MRAWILCLTVLGGCATGDAGLYGVTDRSRHFDLTLARGGAGDILAIADEAYELYAELLDVRPPRCKVAVVDGPAELESVFGVDGKAVSGVYIRCCEPLIGVYPPADARVIRHEVAHHFLHHVLGEHPRWLGEGLAEILEQARRVHGRPTIALVDPEHIESYLDVRRRPAAAAGPLLHDHMNYSTSWAIAAWLLLRESGTLRERVSALRRHVGASPETLQPSEDELLGAALTWTRDLEQMLDHSDHARRAAGARVLGLIGETVPLRRAFQAEQPFWVRCAIAGALARNGIKDELREIVPQLCCENALFQVSLASGRAFTTQKDLEAWINE